MTNRRVSSWGRGANLNTILLILAALAISLGISARAGCASAATTASSQRNTSLDAAMAPLFATENFKEAAISPDGQRVAWVRSLHEKDGTPTSRRVNHFALRGIGFLDTTTEPSNDGSTPSKASDRSRGRGEPSQVTRQFT